MKVRCESVQRGVLREAYLVIRAGLARHAKKAGLAGRAIVLSSEFWVF